MRKVLELGKVGYMNPKVKNCPATIEIELRDKGKGPELSICATIWNHLRTDCYCCGQCVDTVAAFFPHNKKVQRMKQLWERYHLNDMKAGCEHQRAAGWEDRRIKPEELPNTHANRDERGIVATWVKKSEHSDGLLCEPCPVCGYKYGTAWLYEEIPADILAEIREIMGVANNGN